MWRPKGWKNLFNPAAVRVEDRNGKPISHYDAYQLGADAMLEALFKLAEESPTKTFTFDSRVISIYREE